jgi:vitamin K-dependent gamma-carboxylase
MQRLLRPVDAAWLAAFRFLYGIALAISMWRLVEYGWVERFFVRPRFFFKYWGFGWVTPLSGPTMQALLWTLVALALCVALGFAYRLTVCAFALGLIYIQLIDVSTYLNHYYLAGLLALLLAVSPAGRVWSVDEWLKRHFLRQQPARAELVSTAWLYLFRFQVGVVYVFAGLAKLQSDWLLHGQPLRIWLGASVDLPVLGALFTQTWAPLLLSWAGFLFDTTIVGFLLWPRTRPFAYVVVLVFHTMTRLLFPIGMFPVIMSISALMFFSPSWPRNLLERLRLGSAVKVDPAAPGASHPRWAGPLVALGAVYCAVQLALPLRYLAYGGNVLWHEQGMRFSWRVMVRAKGGGTTFVVYSPRANRTFHVPPSDYLNRFQEAEMSSQPDLIVQLARHIQRDFAARGYGEVEVRADSKVGLNGRRSVPMIDPTIDLTRVADGLARARYILPAPEQPPRHTRAVL